MVNDHDAIKLQTIIERDYQISITVEQAKSIGQKLVNLYSIILSSQREGSENEMQRV